MKNVDTDVFFYKAEKCEYPQMPYAPSVMYAELGALPYEISLATEKNEVYEGIREILANLGYDKENFGTAQWNPFKDMVNKGDNVLIKPNMVFHKHPLGDVNMVGMVTQAAVIRPLIDYVLLATGGEVKLTIGDCPVQAAKFERVAELSGIKELVAFYETVGVSITLVDMRMVVSELNDMDVKCNRHNNEGRTKEDYITVDLKEKSELIEVIEKANRFEITDYGYGAVKKHHSMEKNEYKIPREVLEADFIINVPKMKTHRKAGLTCAMKNLVGINGDKTCLAHHTRGTVEQGGDEFSKFNYKNWFKYRVWTLLNSNKLGLSVATGIKMFFQKFVWKGKTMKEYNMQHRPSHFSEGSWHGNDTIWRCVKDLNKIIYYADKKGNMTQEKQRKYLCIVDAVIAGEGEGPMEQTNKNFGVVFGGENPVYIDYVVSLFMKYDYRNIPTVREGFVNKWWNIVDKNPEQVNIVGNKDISEVRQYFVPTFGWQERLTELK